MPIDRNDNGYRIPITIASSGTNSSSVLTKGKNVRGLAVLIKDGFNAGNIGFEGSWDNSTWYPVVDSAGANVVIADGTFDEVLHAPSEVWALQAFTYIRITCAAQAGGAREGYLFLLE